MGYLSLETTSSALANAIVYERNSYSVVDYMGVQLQNTVQVLGFVHVDVSITAFS